MCDSLSLNFDYIDKLSDSDFMKFYDVYKKLKNIIIDIEIKINNFKNRPKNIIRVLDINGIEYEFCKEYYNDMINKDNIPGQLKIKQDCECIKHINKPCWFYYNNGKCSNKDCKNIHIENKKLYNKLCTGIMHFGSCKYEQKDCWFAHSIDNLKNKYINIDINTIDIQSLFNNLCIFINEKYSLILKKTFEYRLPYTLPNDKPMYIPINFDRLYNIWFELYNMSQTKEFKNDNNLFKFPEYDKLLSFWRYRTFCENHKTYLIDKFIFDNLDQENKPKICLYHYNCLHIHDFQIICKDKLEKGKCNCIENNNNNYDEKINNLLLLYNNNDDNFNIEMNKNELIDMKWQIKYRKSNQQLNLYNKILQLYKDKLNNYPKIHLNKLEAYNYCNSPINVNELNHNLIPSSNPLQDYKFYEDAKRLRKINIIISKILKRQNNKKNLVKLSLNGVEFNKMISKKIINKFIINIRYYIATNKLLSKKIESNIYDSWINKKLFNNMSITYYYYNEIKVNEWFDTNANKVMLFEEYEKNKHIYKLWSKETIGLNYDEFRNHYIKSLNEWENSENRFIQNSTRENSIDSKCFSLINKMYHDLDAYILRWKIWEDPRFIKSSHYLIINKLPELFANYYLEYQDFTFDDFLNLDINKQLLELFYEYNNKSNCNYNQYHKYILLNIKKYNVPFDEFIKYNIKDIEEWITVNMFIDNKLTLEQYLTATISEICNILSIDYIDCQENARKFLSEYYINGIYKYNTFCDYVNNSLDGFISVNSRGNTPTSRRRNRTSPLSRTTSPDLRLTPEYFNPAPSPILKEKSVCRSPSPIIFDHGHLVLCSTTSNNIYGNNKHFDCDDNSNKYKNIIYIGEFSDKVSAKNVLKELNIENSKVIKLTPKNNSQTNESFIIVFPQSNSKKDNILKIKDKLNTGILKDNPIIISDFKKFTLECSSSSEIQTECSDSDSDYTCNNNDNDNELGIILEEPRKFSSILNNRSSFLKPPQLRRK